MARTKTKTDKQQTNESVEPVEAAAQEEAQSTLDLIPPDAETRAPVTAGGQAGPDSAVVVVDKQKLRQQRAEKRKAQINSSLSRSEMRAAAQVAEAEAKREARQKRFEAEVAARKAVIEGEKITALRKANDANSLIAKLFPKCRRCEESLLTCVCTRNKLSK
jgi:hypothetical protein